MSARDIAICAQGNTYNALEADAPRLFGHGEGIRTVLLSGPEGPVEEDVIPDLPSLQDYFRLRLRPRSYDVLFYIFLQKTTWSKFGFSKDMVALILKEHQVFPSFLDCLQSFVQKSSEDVKIWDSFYSKANIRPELCYTIRYFERNGRSSGNPWSLRQTAIYQQFDNVGKQWVWFLIQPSQAFRTELVTVLRNGSGLGRPCLKSPVLVHRLCLTIALSSFGEYVDAVHAEVVKMSSKACFSTVGSSLKHDFEVTFRDLQALQLLKQKLLRATRVLESDRSVCEQLQQSPLIHGSDSLDELSNSANLIDMHIRQVTMSFRFADETDKLLSKVLDARRDEVLLQTNAAMQANLEMLKRIAFIGGEENQKLSKISSNTLKDSRTLKSLTTIATMYLPASLIATIFSSGLVRLRTPVENESASRGFALATEFWIYIVATLLLTGLTGGSLVLLKGSWRNYLPRAPNP